MVAAHQRHDETEHRAFDEATAILAGDCLHDLAFSVLDPDWEMTTDPETPYRVKYEGEWLPVARNAVVNANNIVGIAKVWPVANSRGGKAEIRCFLPGSGV